MFLEKLLMILLQAKGGVVAVFFATSTAVAVTGTLGAGTIDLTIHPAEGTPTTMRITLPSPTPTASPTLVPTSTPTSTAAPLIAATPVPSVTGSCSADAEDRDEALEVLHKAGDEAADLLRVAGAVALANSVDRTPMREQLKTVGHEIRDVLKRAMHDVRDLGKRILGDCDEAHVEGLVSRLEHELDEVAEVHEEFESGRSTSGAATFTVTVTVASAHLVAPYREPVDEAVADVGEILEELSQDLDR